MFFTRAKLSANSWMKDPIDGAFSCWAPVLMQADGIDGGDSLPAQKNGPFNPPVPGWPGVVAINYSNRSPFAFVDGHAASLNPQQTVNPQAARAGGGEGDQFLKMWDATRTTDN